ncbi:hypothetical protein EON65_54815 [archaeon]|nr:MAG: hypothetical protein EON65_54815 [archaeon]
MGALTLVVLSAHDGAAEGQQRDQQGQLCSLLFFAQSSILLQQTHHSVRASRLEEVADAFLRSEGREGGLRGEGKK